MAEHEVSIMLRSESFECDEEMLEMVARKVERLERIVKLAKEMRYYCLGSDATTINLIKRFDALLTGGE